MSCPLCQHPHGHKIGCRLDGAKSYELEQVIGEMVTMLKEWFRAENEGDTVAMLDVSIATRRFLFPRDGEGE